MTAEILGAFYTGFGVAGFIGSLCLRNRVGVIASGVTLGAGVLLFWSNTLFAPGQRTFGVIDHEVAAYILSLPH